MSSTRRTITLVTLALYVLLCTVGSGWVVCAGSAGHIAVEAVAAGCCGETPAPVDLCGEDSCGHDGDHDEHDDGCGDCDDVRVGDLATARKSQDENIVAPAALPASVSPIASLIVARPDYVPAAPRGPPRDSPYLRQLTTVILRL